MFLKWKGSVKREPMKILRLKGNLDDLQDYGFVVIQYAGGIVYSKELPNGNSYRVSGRDGGILHYNQNTVNNELDDTVYRLILDGRAEPCDKNWMKIQGNDCRS